MIDHSLLCFPGGLVSRRVCIVEHQLMASETC